MGDCTKEGWKFMSLKYMEGSAGGYYHFFKPLLPHSHSEANHLGSHSRLHFESRKHWNVCGSPGWASDNKSKGWLPGSCKGTITVVKASCGAEQSRNEVNWNDNMRSCKFGDLTSWLSWYYQYRHGRTHFWICKMKIETINMTTCTIIVNFIHRFCLQHCSAQLKWANL